MDVQERYDINEENREEMELDIDNHLVPETMEDGESECVVGDLVIERYEEDKT